MNRLFCMSLGLALISSSATPGLADDKDATAILDKAITAMGGEAKLAKAATCSWKTKGTITFNDSTNDFSTSVTMDGLDRYRGEFAGDFGGNEVKGVTVLDRDKGVRSFNDNRMEMDEEAVANEKRTIYLQASVMQILPLKGKGFKVEADGEEKVGDKPANKVKVKGPDGKDFTLYFDKESGLPVKQVAEVKGWQGQEFTQVSKFGDYKDFDGIKRATKVESTRDGEKFLEYTVTEYKVIDKPDAKLFSEVK